ncbi:MAG: type I restriction endonuclease subunit R, partial [Phycisphaerales bacterium]|nr:type I restriction endonuclease subunit R [Phycisphaerales bacterium]
MPGRGTETEFELATIDRLVGLGYSHIHASDLTREPQDVILHDLLARSIARLNSRLPAKSIPEFVRLFSRPDGLNTIRRNMKFHGLLRSGTDDVRVEFDDGTVGNPHVRVIDWDRPDNNEFLVVNQLSVAGSNDRRPDLVVYINGLPLAVFELKNPYDERPTVNHALNQIGHYTEHIPQLFECNAVTVVSDGLTTLHGMWTSGPEWFAPWKSIDGKSTEPATTGSMKTLLEGLFTPERFLAYIRDFIVFEEVQERITKKGAKYHQYFAVRKAVEKTVEAATTGNDRRVGVIWHTTGSGKSLSMAYLVGILRRQPELQNPSIVIQVDRTDLDDQLYEQFVAARDLVGIAKQAESVDDLRGKLQTEGGELILTTIEKFRLKQDSDGADEIEHPVLTDRSNVIVIADEAHRSQYGFMSGFARYMNEALPNAMRIGFTGTPVSLAGADTREVFGEYIDTYDIQQAQDDGATVPIFYEPRQVKLGLDDKDLDQALEEITDEIELDDKERKKGRWAALAELTGSKERLEVMSKDLLAHFLERTATFKGKAMIVCMTRDNCVRLYEALNALPDCPEMKVVMTGDLSRDPKAWSEAGHITTKRQRDAIKSRLKDPDDPLQIAIVCDMWLTGTDIPCLHTLYVDKPM